MTTINLKDFYYWYLTDELVEVPDEVAEELMASKRREAAHAERVRYNKACPCRYLLPPMWSALEWVL